MRLVPRGSDSCTSVKRDDRVLPTELDVAGVPRVRVSVGGLNQGALDQLAPSVKSRHSSSTFYAIGNVSPRHERYEAPRQDRLKTAPNKPPTCIADDAGTSRRMTKRSRARTSLAVMDQRRGEVVHVL
jgi:hypothetical protein